MNINSKTSNLISNSQVLEICNILRSLGLTSGLTGTRILNKAIQIISIKDFGTNLFDEEMPLLKEKFKRGKNSEGTDGVGLGLYISTELLRKMNGNLEIENEKPGFKVSIYLRII